MPSGKIQKSTVDACQPGEKQVLLWDSKDTGFGLLVLPSGVKSYVFQYRLGGKQGKTRRYTIGRHGAWTADGARKRAQELRAQVVRGIDPIDAEKATFAERERAQAAKAEAERLLQELAFAAYVDDFIGKALSNGKRDRTKDLYAQSLRSHAVPVLKQKPIPQIRKADINKVLDKIPSEQPAVRRNVFAVLRILFNWAIDRGDIEASPMASMKAPAAAESRDRVLSDEELSLAVRAADTLGAPFGPLYRLIFMTGQRRDECAAASWQEFNREAAIWTLLADRTKNGEAHIVPLAPALVSILDRLAGQEGAEEPKWPRRGLLFSTERGKEHVKGYSRAKARLDTAIAELAVEDAEKAGDGAKPVQVGPWRIHDARRTLATGFQRLGIRFEVTEAVLNHVSGASRSGIAAVYQRHNWADEKRAALYAWAEHIERLLASQPTSNVVQFPSPGGQTSTATSSKVG
jgi:integrase